MWKAAGRPRRGLCVQACHVPAVAGEPEGDMVCVAVCFAAAPWRSKPASHPATCACPTSLPSPSAHFLHPLAHLARSLSGTGARAPSSAADVGLPALLGTCILGAVQARGGRARVSARYRVSALRGLGRRRAGAQACMHARTHACWHAHTLDVMLTRPGQCCGHGSHSDQRPAVPVGCAPAHSPRGEPPADLLVPHSNCAPRSLAAGLLARCHPQGESPGPEVGRRQALVAALRASLR